MIFDLHNIITIHFSHRVNRYIKPHRTHNIIAGRL